MADDAIRRSSLDGIKQMRAEGPTQATPADAPEIELDEAFRRSARIVRTGMQPKTSVHPRIDPETFAFFREGSKGHLTRMAKLLKACARNHGKRAEG